jgi:DNA-binding NtrC family response regulator
MGTGRKGWRDVIASAPARGRVLVVEDEAEVRKTLHRLLTRMGHSARGAASAEEADQWLASERFDVLLLDIELPRMSGTEFLEWAQKRDPELPVIMLTGLDDPDVAIACLEAGARTYLVKPVEAEFLRLALRDALALRKVLVERNDLSSGRA